MKKLIFITSFFISVYAIGQSKYEAGMAKALVMLKEAKTSADFADASSLFERIGDAEKTQWLPYYYAALSLYRPAMTDENIDKDKTAEKCNTLIAKADALDKNADLYCLHQQIAVLQMMVDPMNRWQTYGPIANQALEDAAHADPNNPRIYFLKGMTAFRTPEAYGGGKQVAKPLFQKSVELFKTFQPSSPLHPNWGKEQAEAMLAQCN